MERPNYLKCKELYKRNVTLYHRITKQISDYPKSLSQFIKITEESKDFYKDLLYDCKFSWVADFEVYLSRLQKFKPTFVKFVIS